MAKTVENYLDEIDYKYLNSNEYVPTEFALTFMNFIKLVNGAQGESNKTSPTHLRMMDKIATRKSRKIVNLCHRGLAKALALDTPILTTIGWKTIATLQVGDYIYGEDGNPTKVLVKSKVFNKAMYKITLTDGRYLNVSRDHINVIIQRKTVREDKKKYTKYIRREVTTEELLNIKLYSARKKTSKNPKGIERLVWIPNPEPVNTPTIDLPLDPYTLGLILGDGNISKNTGYARLTCHVNDLDHYKQKIPYKLGTTYIDKRNSNVATISILGIGAICKKLGINVVGRDKFIPDIYFSGSIDQRLELLKGLMDTDGSASGISYFSSTSQQLIEDVKKLVYSLGGSCSIHKYKNSFKLSVFLKLDKFSLPRKLDKQVKSNSLDRKVGIYSIEPIEQVPSQCIYVDNKSHTFLAGEYIVTHNTTIFGEYFLLYVACFGSIPKLGKVHAAMYVADTMDNGAKSLRKNIEYRYENSSFLKNCIPIAKFTDNYIEFTNKSGHKLGIKLFGATSGIRGSKIFGKRPTLAILDDLISDEASKSKATMELIKDTVYKGINYALDPTNSLTIFNGTPFNKEDIIVEAVESGAWEVNVFPVCERFPCKREDFSGSWEDRFTYDYVLNEYESAKSTGKLNSFYQELMLRITTKEERLIQDSEINWYDRINVLKYKGFFNFYITTDFATSEKSSADYSVIGVWAYNEKGDWFLVDGLCKRQSMDKNIDALFKYIQEYNPLSVGIEASATQKAFIQWIQKEMFSRNIWFNLACYPNNEPGIRPDKDKFSRFNFMVPLFKANKIYFPNELKETSFIQELVSEISLVTFFGIKGKDDGLDMISQLNYLQAWKPMQKTQDILSNSNNIWEDYSSYDDNTNLNSYIV